MIKAIIFDFNRTLFDPVEEALFDGVEDLLANLKERYWLGLISLGGRERRAQIDKLRLGSYFEKIIIALEKKAQNFEDFCQKLNIQPEEVLVVGDRVRSEIMLANQLGMVTVWLKKGIFASVFPANKDEKPDFIINSLKSLVNILENL